MDVVPELVLELKVMEARRAGRCLWGEKSWALFCSVPSPCSSFCSSGSRVVFMFLTEVPNEKGWEKRGNEKPSGPSITAHEREYKPNQIWFNCCYLGFWAKQNLLCSLIPLLTREEQNSTSLCHLWELKSTWASRQGEGSPVVHVLCPGIFKNQEKDKCCTWDKLWDKIL